MLIIYDYWMIWLILILIFNNICKSWVFKINWEVLLRVVYDVYLNKIIIKIIIIKVIV